MMTPWKAFKVLLYLGWELFCYLIAFTGIALFLLAIAIIIVFRT